MNLSNPSSKQFRFNKEDYAKTKPFLIRQKMYDPSLMEQSLLSAPSKSVDAFELRQIERKFLTPNPLRLPSCCQTYNPHNPISVQFYTDNMQKPSINELKKQDGKFYKYMERLNKPKTGKVKSELYNQLIQKPANTSFIQMNQKTEQLGFMKIHSLEGFKRSFSASYAK
ncbi:Hypothetical_protein [Hexamita inflata]|uniref:Hypothetical_protein n=1 Tax=Hexamita inflata TaxID=28002 RepID=A0AA86R9J4_9EUKA|nr:Hypothetical protein HINF_LOCUS60890 [Hexamita inflata]